MELLVSNTWDSFIEKKKGNASNSLWKSHIEKKIHVILLLLLGQLKKRIIFDIVQPKWIWDSEQAHDREPRVCLPFVRDFLV